MEGWQALLDGVVHSPPMEGWQALLDGVVYSPPVEGNGLSLRLYDRDESGCGTD